MSAQKLDLGPLPDADNNSVLEQASLAALRGLLPPERFVLRDERETDLGVDASLELRIDGKGTNFRSQLQLKARSGLTINQDGSYSVPMPTANLNYMLNGLCPIYLLYIAETKEIRFAFARDELKRILTATPDWMKQGHVSLRFGRVLDATALDEIHRKVLEEARLHRQLHDYLTPLAPQAAARLQIQPGNLTIQTANAAARVLEQDGMALISAGFPQKVLELAALLGHDDFERAPRLLLVRSFAEFSNRNYLRADAPVREALLSMDRLSNDDQQFALFLANAIEMAMGQLTTAEFTNKSKQWRDSAPEYLAVQYDVLHHWILRSEAVGTQAFAEAELQLRKSIDRAEALATMPESGKLYARLLRFFIDSGDACERLLNVMRHSKDPWLWQRIHSEPPSVVIPREQARLEQWREGLNKHVDAIRDTANASLYCEACIGRDLCDIMILSQLHMTAAVLEQDPPTVHDAFLDRVRKTAEMASRLGLYEFELRAQLNEAELEDMRGNVERAKEIANLVRRKAAALRYRDVERIAADMAKGNRVTSKFVAEATAALVENFDATMAALSDEVLERQAQDACVMLQIPLSRSKVALDAAKCERETARQRLTWCRHLRMLEDPRNLHDPFIQAPEKLCHCELRQVSSFEPSTNWRSIIGTFKSIWCDGCTAREPAGSDPAATF
ncbi:DUF4365 domain-containing protein [Polyangium sp. 15x6]|uniref:DUF4365 domain-containing protein n=1 Tax=Polyangium sp. 15x6 TaxID=3042687 RepID=UPI00249B3B16|nr:DUF4365 domain-containing protein [Polyangium sp. 15x6]MDI3291920.1 DUF4365 domain-containing protein [Polyangium sp. 15x6]